MLDILYFVVIGYSTMVVTWVVYLALMNIAKVKEELHPIAKIHAYVLLAIGGALDVTFNVVFGSVLFLEPPEAGKMLFTSRLKKHINGTGWRSKIAKWICLHLLDQFDKDGNHCS